MFTYVCHYNRQPKNNSSARFYGYFCSKFLLPKCRKMNVNLQSVSATSFKIKTNSNSESNLVVTS